MDYSGDAQPDREQNVEQSASTSKQLACALSLATWPKSLHVWHSASAPQWTYGVIVAFWLFFAGTQGAYVFGTNGWFVICDFEGHMHRTKINGALVRAVANFAAFAAYRGLHLRAVASGAALRFERAFAVGALVFRTREARGGFVGRPASSGLVHSVACCSAFVAHYMPKFLCQSSLHSVQYFGTIAAACSMRLRTTMIENQRRDCSVKISKIKSEL